ncbi:hypothetical protein MAPG_07690 [Magnaporthiopsis poae ATCC 64411]|uniref:Secreted protein n=1 Tax=Magnaporthiopsis poae (strain ATCC 64411 / 73-15) TaxID=644358 RepID=A0A0C4E5C4_MAGP6|nr:hypothetical protein MAPG_07690 [Magnaporthiopsis poae ATCC 64411]
MYTSAHPSLLLACAYVCRADVMTLPWLTLFEQLGRLEADGWKSGAPCMQAVGLRLQLTCCPLCLPDCLPTCLPACHGMHSQITTGAALPQPIPGQRLSSSEEPKGCGGSIRHPSS